jgi:thiamine-monophosphate kinase
MFESENDITKYLADNFSKTYNSYVDLGIGDDCAILNTSKADKFVVTTDILIENHHFKKEWISAKDLAKRAFVQNFADVAAMGAKGFAAVVSLALPSLLEKSEKWIIDFVDGLTEIAIENNVAIVGGDLSGSEAIVVNIAAFGDLEGRSAVLRSGAKVGNVLAVSNINKLGLSLKGYLEFNSDNANADSGAKKQYLVPSSDFKNGIIAAKSGATAMMDISDGLYVDSSRIAKASGVRIELFQALDNVNPEYYYFGGEDHEYLATFPNKDSIPKGWTQVGKITEGSPVVCGEEIDKLLAQGKHGWDHFLDK